MADPTSTTVATIVAAPAVVATLAIAGVELGLRPDLLVAGFAGALTGIVLLSTVPQEGSGWLAVASATFRRLMVAIVSALTAGYLTPMLLLPTEYYYGNGPDAALLLGAAFAVGAGAQQVLRLAMRRIGALAEQPQQPSREGD